jgi:hypothetical protein
MGVRKVIRATIPPREQRADVAWLAAVVAELARSVDRLADRVARLEAAREVADLTPPHGRTDRLAELEQVGRTIGGAS